MGPFLRCVLAASALLHPLVTEVNATPLRAELLPNDQSHMVARFFGDPCSPANVLRLALSEIYADAAGHSAVKQNLHSSTDDNVTSLQLRHQKRAGAAIAPGSPANGWTYSGCYADNGSLLKNAINFGFFWQPSSGALLSLPQEMNAALCTASCSLNGLAGKYTYAGLSGETCYCFNRFPTDKVDDDTCDQPCLTENEESCGRTAPGDIKLTIFIRSEDVPAEPVDGLAEWEYLACYSLEGNAYAALADGLAIGYSTDVSNDALVCITICNRRGYWLYAGLLGNGCFCSNNAPINGTDFPEEYCKATCPGTPTMACGGLGYTNSWISGYRRKLEIRPPAEIPSTADGPWFYKGCYNMKDDFQDQGVVQLVDLGPDATADTCIHACDEDEGHYELAGLYESICYCANKDSSYLTREFLVPSQDCDTRCLGDEEQPCGGDTVIEQGADPHRSITLYGRSIDFDPDAPLPVIVPGAVPWINLGCYSAPDISTTAPLVINRGAGSTASPENCINACKQSNNWLYAVAYDDGTCVCTGEPPQEDTRLADDSTECDLPCAGYEKEFCGTKDGGDGNARIRFWQNPLTSARPSEFRDTLEYATPGKRFRMLQHEYGIQ